jgi:hypothetical protein
MRTRRIIKIFGTKKTRLERIRRSTREAKKNMTKRRGEFLRPIFSLSIAEMLMSRWINGACPHREVRFYMHFDSEL